MFSVVVNWFYLVAENVKENGRKFWLFSPSALVFFFYFSVILLGFPEEKQRLLVFGWKVGFFFFPFFLQEKKYIL